MQPTNPNKRGSNRPVTIEQANWKSMIPDGRDDDTSTRQEFRGNPKAQPHMDPSEHSSERDTLAHELLMLRAELEQRLAALHSRDREGAADAAIIDLSAQLTAIDDAIANVLNGSAATVASIVQSLPSLSAAVESLGNDAQRSGAVQTSIAFAEMTVDAIQHYSIAQIGSLSTDHYMHMSPHQLHALSDRITHHSITIADRANGAINKRVEEMRRSGQDPEALIRQRDVWQREMQAAAARGDLVEVADGAMRLAYLGGDEQDIADAREAAIAARITRFHQENPDATRDQAKTAQRDARLAVETEANRAQEVVDALTTDQPTRDATITNALQRRESIQRDAMTTGELRSMEIMETHKVSDQTAGFDLAKGLRSLEMPIAAIGNIASPQTPAARLASASIVVEPSSEDEAAPAGPLDVAQVDPADRPTPATTPRRTTEPTIKTV